MIESTFKNSIYTKNRLQLVDILQLIGIIKPAIFPDSSSNSLQCKWNFWLFPYRSRHLRRSVKKGILRNSAKFTGKHLSQNLFFNKVAGWSLATLLKKGFWHRKFSCEFNNISKNKFSTEHLQTTASVPRTVQKSLHVFNQKLPSYSLFRPFVALNYNFWISSQFFS